MKFILQKWQLERLKISEADYLLTKTFSDFSSVSLIMYILTVIITLKSKDQREFDFKCQAFLFKV